jgi:hypothetical protein
VLHYKLNLKLLNARLSEKADNLQLAEEQLFKLYALFQNTKFDGEINYPDSFNIRDYASDLMFYQQAKAINVQSPTLAKEIDKEIARAVVDDDEKLNIIFEEIEINQGWRIYTRRSSSRRSSSNSRTNLRMSDIIKDATQYRIKQIELAEARYYETLIKTLDKIEAEVVSLAGRLPTTDGKLIELQSAIAIRPQIKAILEREYLAWSDTVVREGFNKQAKRIEKAFKTIGNIPVEFQELTKGDLALIQNLKQQYFTQFKDVSNTFTRKLSEKVYQNTLVGSDFTVLEKELRQTINGIYASSDDPESSKIS